MPNKITPYVLKAPTRNLEFPPTQAQPLKPRGKVGIGAVKPTPPPHMKMRVTRTKLNSYKTPR